MATTPSVILAPTTAGGTSNTFEVEFGPVTVRLSGADAVLAPGETATLQYQDATGTWRSLVDVVSGAGIISAGETNLRIEDSGTYRVGLSPTGDLTGLEIVASSS